MRQFQTHNIPKDARGAAVAIGNFDGVHLGHQAIIDVARKQAKKNNTQFPENLAVILIDSMINLCCRTPTCS